MKNLTKKTLNNITFILLFFVVNIFYTDVFGAIRTFQYTSGTYTWDATNWGGTLPGPADDCIINTDGNLVITGTPTVSILSLTISGTGSVEFQATSPAKTITITNTSTGVNIESGHLILGSLIVLRINASVPLNISNTAQLTVAGNTSTKLNIYGIANNYGIINFTTAITTNTLYAGGVLNNYNAIQGSIGSTIANAGTINNEGTITCTTLKITISNGGIINNSGTLTGSGSNISWQSGSLYNHAQNGGTVPTASWVSGSECRITGVINSMPSNILQTYNGRFHWNCEGQTDNLVFNSTGLTGSLAWGGFTCSSTGSGSLSLGTSSSNYTFTINASNGGLTVSGGTLNLHNGSGVATITLNEHFSYTGGSLLCTSSSPAVFNFAAASKTIDASGLSSTPLSSQYNINWFITGGDRTLNSNFYIADGKTFTVGQTNTLNIAGENILGPDGKGTLVLHPTSNWSTLGIGSVYGITPNGTGPDKGNVQCNRSFPAGRYAYIGTSDQVTGEGLPTVIANLTINNTGGIVSLTNDLEINGASPGLTFTNGILAIGNKDLLFSNSATTYIISGGGAGKFIATNGTGQVKRYYSANHSFLFALGDIDGTNDYSPTTIQFTTIGAARTVGVRVFDIKHPNDNSYSDYITRYWEFTDDGLISGTYSITLTYSTAAPSDLVGTGANLKVNRWNGTSWSEFTTSGTLPARTATGITTASNPLNNSSFTARNTSLQYLWNGSESNDWTVANNWTPARTTPAATDILTFHNTTATIQNIPTQTIRDLIIQGNSNISLESSGTSTITLNGALIVENNATLQIGTGTNTIGFTLGVAGTIADISGHLIVNTNGTFTTTTATTSGAIVTGTLSNAGGTVTSTAASLRFMSGSIYNHQRDGGALPTATWNSNSDCNILSPNTAPTLGAQTLGNLKIKTVASVTTTLNGATVVSGNLDIIAGTLATGAQVLSVNGTTTIDGTLHISGAGAKTFDGLVTVNSSGTWNHSANIGITLRGGIFNNGTFTTNTGTSATYTFAQNNQELTGTFVIPRVTVTGISLTNNGTLSVATVLGGTGELINKGTLTISTTNLNFSLTTLTASETGNTVVYGTAGAINVRAIPYHNLVIDGGNTKTLQGTIALSGNLTLQSGILAIGTNTLTLGLNSAILGTFSATSMITHTTGSIQKSFNTPLSQNFPVGTGTNYTPALIDITDADFAGDAVLTIRLVAAKAPEQINNSNSLSKYWEIDVTNISSIDAELLFSYVQAEADATYEPAGSYIGAFYNGSSWDVSGIVDKDLNTISFNLVNSASISGNWTAGPEFAFAMNSDYYSIADGNWESASTWSTTGYGGAPASSPPAPNSNVHIGNGKIVTKSTTSSYTLNTVNIEPTGTLDCGSGTTSSSLNIGTLTVSGTVKLGSATLPIVAANQLILNSGSIVEYYNTTIYTIPSSITTYHHLHITGSGTKTLGTSITVNGNVQITTGVLSTGANTLAVKGNLVNNGRLTTNATAATLMMNGTVAQSISGSGEWQTAAAGRLQNLTINNTSGSTPAVDIQSSFTIPTGLTLTNGILGNSNGATTTLGIGASSTLTVNRSNGSVDNGANIAYNLSGVIYNVNYNAALSSYTTGKELAPATSGTVTNLTINFPSGIVTLDFDVNAGRITLTDGIFDTQNAVFTITGTLTSSVTGGSPTSYIRGMLIRTLPANNTTGTFTFPIGKSSYNLFELINPATNASPILITVEVFDEAPGGTDGSGFIAFHNRYVSALVSGAGALTSIGSVRMTDLSLTPSISHAVGISQTKIGQYDNFGCTNPSSPANTITTSISVPTTLGYFQIGSGLCISPTLQPKANNQTNLYIPSSGDRVELLANTNGGVSCAAWEYAWYNGTHYWDGTGFNSLNEYYSSSFFKDIFVNVNTNTTFIAFVRCSSDATCSSSAQTTVTIDNQLVKSVNPIPNYAPSSTSLSRYPWMYYNSDNTTSYRYMWSRNLLPSDVASAGFGGNPATIKAMYIPYQKGGNQNVLSLKNCNIYMRLSSAANISSTDINYPRFNGAGGWTQVLNNATLNYANSSLLEGEAHITFDTPFEYDGISGIDILFERLSGDYYTTDWFAGRTYAAHPVTCISRDYASTESSVFSENGNSPARISSNVMPVKFGYYSCAQILSGPTPSTTQSCSGNEITISITATGNGNLTYQWQKNNQDISNGGGYSGTNTSVLTINPSNISHTGNYRCIVYDECPSSIPSSSVAIAVGPANIVLHNTGSLNQNFCFNNSKIKTTSPVFRISASTNCTSYDRVQVELNTLSTFSGISYSQTFTGAFLNDTENEHEISGWSPTNGTVYYVRARVSEDGGSTYSAWSTQQFSFTYESGVASTEWQVGNQYQFMNTGYGATGSIAINPLNVTYGNGSNVINEGSFEQDWTTHWGYSTFFGCITSGYVTTYSDVHGVSDGTLCQGIRNDGPMCATGSLNNYLISGRGTKNYQFVNLTGVNTITFDYTYYDYQGGSTGTAVDGQTQLQLYIDPAGGFSNNPTGTNVWSSSSYVATGNGSYSPSSGQNTVSIDISGYGFTTGNSLQFVNNCTQNSSGATRATPIYYIDNVQAISYPASVYTSPSVQYASFVNAAGWAKFKWNQTVGDELISFKIQKSTNGSSWTDVAGMTAITSAISGNNEYDISSLLSPSENSDVAYLRAVATLQHGASLSYLNSFGFSVIPDMPSVPCATLVAPTHGNTNIELSQILTWNEVSGATSYDVYFGETTPPVFVINTSQTSYAPYLDEYATTYYWKIVPKIGTEKATGCDIWSFTTKPLECAPLNAPIDLAVNVDINQMLYWTALPGNVSYDVYFGTSTPPTFVTNVYENYYNPGVLDFEETYYWSIVPKTVTEEPSNCPIWSFTTMSEPEPEVLTWVGTFSSDWNVAGNWNLNVVPTSFDDVIIPIPSLYINPPIVYESKAEPARCKDMLLSTGAVLTVNPNKALTIHGNLSIAGSIRVKSSGVQGQSLHHSQDGSLMIMGNASGTGTFHVERYFSGNFWHMISAPITHAYATIFTNLWIRTYNEKSNTWGAFVTNPSTHLVPSKGFAVWSYQSSENRTYTGMINNDTETFPMQYTDNPNLNILQKGWNLVGNPYPTAVNWNHSDGWTKEHISSAIYLFSALHGNYVTWNGILGAAGPIIPMGQGFFIQAANENANVQIHKSARVHSEVMFKNQEYVENAIEIEVNMLNERYSDKTYLLIRNDASDEYDFTYDAVKFRGVETAPQLYTYKGEAMLSTQALNDMNSLYGTLLYFEPGMDGQYSLHFTETTTEGHTPVIRDRFRNILIPSDEVYHFSATKGDNPARFEIVDFNTVTEVESLYTGSTITAWEHQNILYVQHADDDRLLSVEIFDILGKQVLQSNAHQTYIDGLVSGIYLVKVFTENHSVVSKIIVR